MKVLFHTDPPFSMAHGGVQTLVEALLRHLPAAGVEVEPLKWWQADQSADAVHYIGRPPHLRAALTREKGWGLIFTDLLDQTASRPAVRLAIQGWIMKAIARASHSTAARLAWDVHRMADAVVYLVPHEMDVSHRLFGTPRARMHAIPLGLEAEALSELGRPAPAGDALLSIATIAPRKNTLLLAQACRMARVPCVFVGKPYSESDPYFRRFLGEVDGQWVRYEGYVSGERKADLLRAARGFALLSRQESGCVAVHEAAAAGLPLFLSRLPWASRGYPPAGVTLQDPASPSHVAQGLAAFYATARRRSVPTFPVLSWAEAAARYAALYRQVLDARASSAAAKRPLNPSCAPTA